MSYRPITDVWLLARPKVKYYGAYPAGFLERARALLGVNINDSVLHVCGGKVRDYPYRGFGPNDKTVDLDESLNPDYVMDVSKMLPSGDWPAILVDQPYTSEDADHYAPGRGVLPEPNQLLARCLSLVRPGGRVGFLHYMAPRPPGVGVRFVALIAVAVGFKNRIRAYSVFERLP